MKVNLLTKAAIASGLLLLGSGSVPVAAAESLFAPVPGVLNTTFVTNQQTPVAGTKVPSANVADSNAVPPVNPDSATDPKPEATNAPVPRARETFQLGEPAAEAGTTNAESVPSNTNQALFDTNSLPAPSADSTSTNAGSPSDGVTNSGVTNVVSTNSNAASEVGTNNGVTNAVPTNSSPENTNTTASHNTDGTAGVSPPPASPASNPPVSSESVIASKKLPSIPVDAPPNLEQSPDVMAASAPPPVAPSENVTLNLINRLVQRGILTKEDAGDLIRQAKEDAQRASQQSQVAQQAATQAATAQQMAMEAAAPPSSDEAVSVSYVPEIVKAEMRDEIKRDVMAAAQSEGWAQPNVPEWVRKFRPFMDFRFRYQGIYFPDGNSENPLDTLNFNWINTGQPFNISQANGNQSPPIGYPTYDTTQNRQQMRIRFRFGADMDLGDNFTGGFRLGTGQNGSPVSENQTLGAAQNGQFGGAGGNFSNYAIWLDRAFLKYELGSDPDRMAALTFGRFDNPFYTPATIMWANDIAFDGIAAQARYKILKGVTPFATAGIFPIFNTDLNFPAQQQPKISSYDKYLYAAQTGIDLKITKDLHYKGSVGYYNFQNVQGQVSAPQVAYNQDTPFSTDASRPTFAQKGNTYMALREIPAVPENNYGTINQFQYFGLATPFQVLSANSRLEYRHWEPFVVSLSGEWDQNLAWNAQNIMNNGPSQLKGNINNPGSNGTGYGGGNNAWIIQTKIGSGALQKRWDWDFGVAYRYVESDAVIDGFCDSDFGGGGTNMKGFSVGGNLALSKSVFIGVRWLSATGIAGPQYKADIIQLDVNSRF
ncbi:MAG: putative porin [Chthoniobacterales bacterium]